MTPVVSAWLFLLVTPVQFIGGWGFYKGAWAAIRSRAINMDFLIALGTSVAYAYSVAVVFFPGSNAIHDRSSSKDIATRAFDFIIKPYKP